jgi:hypothetical protein
LQTQRQLALQALDLLFGVGDLLLSVGDLLFGVGDLLFGVGDLLFGFLQSPLLIDQLLTEPFIVATQPLVVALQLPPLRSEWPCRLR